MPAKTKLTEDLIGSFFRLLAKNGGIVTDAARDLNISRTALYGKRLTDSEFKDQWDQAVDLGVDVIEDEAKRRALTGTEEPVFYQGEIVGYIWKKSDYCIGLVLKAHRFKYRERHEISGKIEGEGFGNTTNIFTFGGEFSRELRKIDTDSLAQFALALRNRIRETEESS